MLYQLYTLLERHTPTFLKQAIPESWRTRLGYEIKVNHPPALNPRYKLAHPLSLPAGTTLESLRAFLADYRLDGAGSAAERDIYLGEAFKRFVYTLQLVPDETGKLLEIGANPYYMSLLLRTYRQYEVSYTNYFGPAFGDNGTETMIGPEGPVRFEFANVNIETEPLPHDDNEFDVAMLCEVLEHFTNDPVHALQEIRRVLKPDGTFILTTPNVNRLVNIGRMIAGHNIYDPYSSYGPYGRHNREYTWAELVSLLDHLGFRIEEMFTSDVRPNETHLFVDPNAAYRLTAHRPKTLGQYIFVRARKGKATGIAQRPDWLYRSLTDQAG